MTRLFKTTITISAALCAVLSACGADTSTSTNIVSLNAAPSKHIQAGDHVLGDPNADIVLIEYASVSCPGCAVWHNDIFPDIKAKFIDTGKIRYVFREYLAANPDFADAGFMIALCAEEDDYFKNISLQFKRQRQIFDQAKKGDARGAYISLAKASGLSEDEFITCMGNQELREGYKARMQLGNDKGVGGTPAFFIGDKRIKDSSYKNLEKALNEALDAASSQ